MSKTTIVLIMLNVFFVLSTFQRCSLHEVEIKEIKKCAPIEETADGKATDEANK